MSGFFARPAALPLRTDARVDADYRRYRLGIIVAITLGYGISYTCRLAINVVKKPLIDGGIFTPDELGVIGSALFYSYAAGKFFNGFVADHVSARRFFALGMLASALCNVAMGFSTTLWVATLVWGLNGWFQSFGAPASVVSLASWYSNAERGHYYGIWTTSHSIGEGLTFAGVSLLVTLFGWHWGYWGPAAAVAVSAIGCYAIMAERPRALGLPAVADWRRDGVAPDAEAAAASAPEGTAREVFAAQLSILRIPTLWILALASALVYVSRYAINSWGVLYLQEARGYSLAVAGSLLAVSTVAGIAGAIGFGFISDKWFAARRPPGNLLFAIVEVIGLVLLFYGPTGIGWTIAAMLLFGLGMTGLVTSVGGLFAVDIAPKRVAGAALGMIGVFSYLGAAIQERVSGYLIDRGMTMVDGVRRYDFGGVIEFWIGASVVSMLLAATLWRAKLRD